MILKKPLNEIPLFQASKWLKLPLLLSVEEMMQLLSYLPKWIVPLSGVITEGKELISQEEFLSLYTDFVTQIDQGIKRPTISSRLVCAFTDDLDSVCLAEVSGGVLMRIRRPVLQVQPYMIHYSSTSKRFVDATHSQNSFAWGLVFSTPQLFQNPDTQEIEKIQDPSFKTLQKWSRAHTIPTPFQVGDTLIHFPARIGKTRKTPICITQK